MPRKAAEKPASDAPSQLWPEPAANDLLLGHDDAFAAFLTEQSGGRLAHAWLITGPAGIGKATFVYKLARHFLGAGSAPLIAAGSHPNLLTVERRFDDKKGRVAAEIPVDDARAVVPFLRMTASDGGWRIAFIDGADFLTIQGQNALLKILEEPPAKSLLFLTALGAGRLLPTIRSRCRTLALKALDRPTAGQLLKRYAPALDAAQAAEISRCADGSIGFALRLAADNARGLTFANQLDTLLETQGPWPQAAQAELATLAARTENDFTYLAEDILTTAVSKEAIRRMTGLAPRLLPHLALETLLPMWEKIAGDMREARDSYLDMRLTWLMALGALRPQSAKAQGSKR